MIFSSELELASISEAVKSLDAAFADAKRAGDGAGEQAARSRLGK